MRRPAATEAWIGEELTALNEAYESLFGFRFVVFVAGRPRADIIPLIERALHADRDEELRRGLDDVVLIASDRMDTLCTARVRCARSSARRSRSRSRAGWSARSTAMGWCARRIGSSRRESSPPPCSRSRLPNQDEETTSAPAVARLMGEIGLGGLGRGTGRPAAGAACRRLDPRRGEPADRRRATNRDGVGQRAVPRASSSAGRRRKATGTPSMQRSAVPPPSCSDSRTARR